MENRTPEFSTRQKDQLDQYFSVLLHWKEKFSLIGSASTQEIVDLHFVDSIISLPWIPEGCRLVDIGSGAGFPGVPIAIASPRVALTLIEVRRKRANFLRHVIRRCKLENVDVAEQRVEEFLHAPHPHFDRVTSRAFAGLETVLNIAENLLPSKGKCLAMVGPEIDAAIKKPFSLEGKINYFLGNDIPRQLLILERE